MRKHYGLVFPLVDGMPILMIDYYQGGKHKPITLKEAKDVVFKAVFQGHQIIMDQDKHELIAEQMIIVDKDEFERSREKWINDNATAKLKEAMDKDAQS